MARSLRILRSCCALAALVAIVALVLGATGIGCPIKFMTGISCPGCGMTRAWLEALQLHLSVALAYHPLFWAVPLAVVAAVALQEGVGYSDGGRVASEEPFGVIDGRATDGARAVRVGRADFADGRTGTENEVAPSETPAGARPSARTKRVLRFALQAALTICLVALLVLWVVRLVSPNDLMLFTDAAGAGDVVNCSTPGVLEMIAAIMRSAF